VKGDFSDEIASAAPVAKGQKAPPQLKDRDRAKALAAAHAKAAKEAPKKKK
jgi:hypothetical protein